MSTLLAKEILLEMVGGDSNARSRKHDVGEATDIVPFTTKRTQALRNHFHRVLGEYVRNISELVLDEGNIDVDDGTFYENPLIGKIMQDMEIEGDAGYDLERFLNQYLFSQGSGMKAIHPYLFNYLPLHEEKGNEIKKHAKFIYQVLVQGDRQIAEIFQNREAEDILTELILSKLVLSKKEGQPKGYKKEKNNKKFQPMLNGLAELYRKDLLFLNDYKDYFLSSFPLLTQFYAFMYICQLLWKFESFENADYKKLKPLYFALEWEAISKRRKAVDEIEGYKRIRDKSQNLFVHVHTLSQLSHNVLSNPNLVQGSQVEVFTYPELIKTIQSHGEETEKKFLQELNDWIQQYISIWLTEEKGKEIMKKIPENLAESFRTLFRCLQEGMNTDACSKFGKNLEDVGWGVFLKSRGSLGTVFNMPHEMLILLTAVCVRNQRIPLNQLFEEYEKRGVAFDRQSKKEIIELLDSLNMLDKKSDSGDAQYVKPIL